MNRNPRPAFASASGYSLVELLVAMTVMTLVMGSTLAGLADVMKGNEVVMSIAQMNNSLRAGTDLMIRDMLQAGSGLPASHAVSIPNGAGAVRVRLPGPPGSNFQTDAADVVLPAVIPRNGAGPIINGVQTDVVSILMADNAFIDIGLTSVATSSVRVAAGPNLTAGATRVTAGQLMMISKGSFNTLVQVTSINAGTRQLNFADNDSMQLNQAGAANGNLAALNAEDPVNDASATRISRMRMITYYLDATTDPMHPRLVRRIDQGHPTSFDNTLGTAVAVDLFDMQFTYDISNGVNNPGGIDMSAADLGVGGACAPDPCAETQIRKISTSLMVRAPNRVSGAAQFMTNRLESQVSLRAMAFVDRYR